jgi:hypothetical protein
VLTLSTRLSAFSYSIGVLASDMGRNFVVIGGIARDPSRGAQCAHFHGAANDNWPRETHAAAPHSVLVIIRRRF